MASPVDWPRQTSPSSGASGSSSSDEANHSSAPDDLSSPRASTSSESHHTRGTSQPMPIPRSPEAYATSDQPLLDQQSRTPARSFSSTHFVSSPLNPNGHGTLASGSNSFSRGLGSSRPTSRTNSVVFNRIASEESQALGGASPGARGSMILYRLASEEDPNAALAPPRNTWYSNRNSVASTSGESTMSYSSDSKYPTGSTHALVAYVFEPDMDDKEVEDDDALHDPSTLGTERNSFSPARGIANIGILVILVLALMALFIAYPVITYVRRNARNLAIDNNIHINSTGQSAVLFNMPEIIDPDTPKDARTRTGFDGKDYELVFSDEFNVDGRSFYPGDDPYWEAVDLWYWATNDLEWYDPKQITTANGNLVITMDSVDDPTTNHGMQYRSGMLQSWNKFCFTTGYIEVAMTFPGPNSATQGYWPGVWTMGNLGRPGYGATTDGMWPYSYDSCDVGTFPNQTEKDQSGPAAAIHSDESKDKYDGKLSILSGQRVSSCTCSGEEHPGPSVSKGRGAPEIDVLEAEKDKAGDGQVVSQSAQFAPFTHDYLYNNDTDDDWYVYDTSISRPNSYRGSAVQQAVSGLTRVPEDMFQGSGQNMTVFGFEYWADPNNRDDGFITWVSDGKPSVRMGPGAVGPDTGTNGSQVSQRLIPEEPMSIVLNLGISTNWQKILTGTMQFPAQMLIDYVRVYQRKGSTNVGCDPKDYPTADYIAAHPEAYNNANLTGWTTTNVPGSSAAGYSWPKNSLYDGC